MNISKLILPGALCAYLIAGCISTTSGRATPEANSEDAAQLNYELGARYFKNGSFELARDRLQLATELNPTLAIAHSTLALTYEALENERLATKSYENALRVAPRDFDVQNSYAVFLCRRERYVSARKYFDKAINHPQNDNAYVTQTNAGVCMRQKPDAALAEHYFRQALDRKSNHGEALLQICLLKYDEQDYLSARAFLQRYIANNLPSAGVLYLASRIEDMLDNDRGRTDYEDQLIRSFPASSEARKVLGAD